MATTVGARLSYERAKSSIESAGFNLNRAVLSQSYLRTEVALSTTQTRYRFPILVNDNFSTTFNTMQLLALQDAFYISNIGIYFANPSTATDASFSLYSYPNATAFPAGAADALNVIYNGYAQLTVNNRVVVPSLDIYRFYDAPQTQQSATTIDQFKGSDSAVYPIEPGVVLIGSKQNVFEIVIPASLAAVTAFSRAVVVFYGHLAQNVTSVN